MIKTANNLVIGLLGKRLLSVIYAKGKLVWQAVRSCFGSGKWVGEKPWIGEEKWKGES